MKEKRKTIEFMIYSKKKETKDGKKFTSYFTFYDFLMPDGTRERKGVTIQFTENAFENVNISQKHIVRGLITCYADAVGCPDNWEVTEDEKTGKDKYPICWIRDGAIVDYVDKKAEHVFHFSQVEADEEETEETNID